MTYLYSTYNQQGELVDDKKSLKELSVKYGVCIKTIRNYAEKGFFTGKNPLKIQFVDVEGANEDCFKIPQYLLNEWATVTADLRRILL